MKIRLIIIIFALVRLYGEAQTVKRPVIVEPKFHTGMNLPLYRALDYLVEDDIYSFDLSLSFPTYGDDYWEKLYRYPRTGIGLSVTSLGNKEVLGNAWSLFKFISIPLFEKDRKFSLDYIASVGCAYLPDAFDIDYNHLNRAIGSHFNLYMRMGMDFRFFVFPRSEIIIGTAFTHFSNGKTKSPNYGLNIGSVSLGINYLFNDKGLMLKDPEIPSPGKKYDQSIILSGGLKVYDNLVDIKYFTSSVVYNIERRLSNVHKTGLGADFFYDASIREALASPDGIPEEDFVKHIRFGLHASYAAQYKRTLFGFQIGYYLYSEYPLNVNVYNKLSLQYLLTKNILGSMAIRSHMGKADCLEFGIGYTW
jgi:hypothetical protein